MMEIRGITRGFEWTAYYTPHEIPPALQGSVRVVIPGIDVDIELYVSAGCPIESEIQAIVRATISELYNRRLSDLVDKFAGQYHIPRWLVDRIITWNDTRGMSIEEIATRLDEMAANGEIDIRLTPW